MYIFFYTLSTYMVLFARTFGAQETLLKREGVHPEVQEPHPTISELHFSVRQTERRWKALYA